MKNTALILLLLTLSACNWLQPEEYTPPEPITVITQQVATPIYHPVLPNEVQLENVQWLVITESNVEEQLEKVRQLQTNEAVVFAITPQGYENLAYNLQELRRYIRQLREIIVYYQSIDTNTVDTPAE